MDGKKVVIYRNSDIERIVAFIPKGHLHVRVLIETKDKVIVLQEATVNALIRAYVNVAFHPKKRVVELKCYKLEDKKRGFAEYQLLESSRREEEILGEIEWYFK